MKLCSLMNPLRTREIGADDFLREGGRRDGRRSERPKKCFKRKKAETFFQRRLLESNIFVSDKMFPVLAQKISASLVGYVGASNYSCTCINGHRCLQVARMTVFIDCCFRCWRYRCIGGILYKV